MRQAIDRQAAFILLLLCFIWGSQQVLIKAVNQDIDPLLQVALRSGIAALLVWLYSRLFTHERWLQGVAWQAGLAAGVLFTLEFYFLAEGLREGNASHMAVFLYTAPLFAALGLHWFIKEERLSFKQWLGVGCSFLGIVVIFLWPSVTDGSLNLTATFKSDLYGLGAGLAWGATTVVVRTSRLSEAPPAQTLFYQLAWAFVLLTPFAYLGGTAYFHGTAMVWGSLLFQGIVVSFITYLTWFWLLRRYLASRLGMMSLLTPIFGVWMGAWLLDEQLEHSFIAGAGLVLLGLLIVNGLPKKRARA